MRVRNWPQALARALERAVGMPFIWGAHDCCQFAASVVAALTGRDPRTLFPTYASEAEAAAILAECGGMEALITRALGAPKPRAFAQRGDIVLCEMGRGAQPAVCVGARCVAPGARGLESRPMTDATAAWSV